MRWLVRAAVTHSTVVNVIMALLLAVGLATLRAIPRESFPKVELDLVSASVIWPGHTPEEVELGIVVKIEEAIKAIPGIDEITGTANPSSGRVFIELAKGADRKKVLDDVRDAVDGIANFPPDIEPPSVKALTNRQPAISLILYGDVSPQALRAAGEKVRDDLIDLKDVSQVALYGLRARELSIQVRPKTLERLGLTLNDVISAVRRANVEIQAGTLRTRREDLTVMVGVRGYTAQALAALPIRTLATGAALTVGDIAQVKESQAEGTYAMRFNGHPAVEVFVQKTDDEDVMAVVAAVKRYTQGLNAGALPTGIKVAPWHDRTRTLNERITLLTRNGILGLVLIFMTLWLFTRFKLSFWVAAGLPVAALGATILIAPTGVTINMISLFGLLLVSGILVDDAIVVSENIYAHVERGKHPVHAAIDGTLEVLPAVSASITTTIIAFIPFFYMGGRIGKFVQAIPVVVICSLLMSWVEALFILPSHLSHALHPINRDHPSRLERIRLTVDATVDRLLTRPYAFSLRLMLRFRWQMVAFGLCTLFIIVGVVRGGLIHFLFFPDLDADDLQAEYLLEPGAPESVNLAIADRVLNAAVATEATLKASQTGHKDVILGRLTTIGGAQSEAGKIQVELLPGEDRDASATAIAKRWREALGPVPEARWLTIGPRRHGPFGKPVHVDLLSTDQHALEAAAAELKRALADYPGTYDISDDLAIGKRERVLTLNPRGKAAGFTLDGVASQLRAGLFGGRVEVLQPDREELEVWVRFPRRDRQSLGQLSELRVKTPQGFELPLDEIVSWTERRGLDTIKRFDRRRRISVSSAVDPNVGNAQDILEDLKANVLPQLTERYPSLKASFEGQSRQRRKMLEGFKQALPWALAGMFAVLVIVFGSYSQGILVMLMIPLGIVGAVAGHMLIGMPLTVLSIWGIVALGGVLVNDSIVLVDAINRRLAAGQALMSAVFEAGVGRLRPILLTTITTSAGLMPIILEQSRQAQFLIPMAASLAFGLLFGTLFTLAVLPAGFVIINDLRQFFGWLRTGYWPLAESLEPAVHRAAHAQDDQA